MSESLCFTHPAPVPTAASDSPLSSSSVRSSAGSTASGPGGKSSIGVEAERLGLLHAGGEVVPEHERPAAGFGDQRDGDGGFHGSLPTSRVIGLSVACVIGPTGVFAACRSSPTGCTSTAVPVRKTSVAFASSSG